MSFALKEISDLLALREGTAGVVVQIGDGTVRVATPSGAITARTTGHIAVGDRVTVRNGFAEAMPVTRVVVGV